MRIVVNVQTGETEQVSGDPGDLPNEAEKVPAKITKAQLKYVTENIAEGETTLWATIKAAIAAADADTQETWDLIHELPRSHPLVVSMAQSLGKSDAEMDAVWIAGAKL